MRFVRRMMRALAVASIIVHGVRTATEDHQPTSFAARTPADVLGDLADRLISSGEDRRPGGFDDAFVSFWNRVGGPHENAVKGRKKKRNQLMTAVATLTDAGSKLILLLPMLAVLIGKSVSLSFTSLIIAALVFLH